MTKDEILKITKPGDLFPRDEAGCKQRYKEYIKIYHPDAKRGDEKVFEHITRLYDSAREMIRTGRWEKTNYVELETKEGKKLRVNYLHASVFELGTCYVCKTHLLYIIHPEQEKYYENFFNVTKRIKYGNSDMETVMKRTMPDVSGNGKLKDGSFYILLNKTEDVYPLTLLLKHLKNVPPEHVAWMMSRLSGICCFLEFNEIVHNGITLDSCFVSPKYHSILLLGGWWYATGNGEKLIGTTGEIYDLMPVTAKTSKVSSKITDLESVKLIGRRLFKEESCRTLKLRTDIPEPVIRFLTKGSSDSAVNEMTDWDKSLTDAFGKRRFVRLDVTDQQIYQ